MYNSDSEIWEAVKKIKGTTLFTYVEKERNDIIDVEDKASNLDRVHIADRDFYPSKEDIISAYKLLTIQGKLKRTDLEWLATPKKRVSSIVFRIIGEISQDHTIFDDSKREPIIILKK